MTDGQIAAKIRQYFQGNRTVRGSRSEHDYAMQRFKGMKDRFDLSFACDTDHDRHGIVTRSVGLLPPNHYLAVAIFYLFQHRPKWRMKAAG